MIFLLISILSCNSATVKSSTKRDNFKNQITTVDSSLLKPLSIKADSTSKLLGQGGCVKCQCPKFSDTDGDNICETPKNNDPNSICEHERKDHM